MKKTTLIWLIALTIAIPFSAQAKEVVYKWVDKNGITHYSSHPPVGQKVEKVNVHISKSKVDAARPAPKTPPVEQVQEEAAAPVTAGPEPTASRKDPKLCEQARKNLWNLKNRAHIYVLDNDTGERTLMSDEERQLRLEETEKQIEELCEK